MKLEEDPAQQIDLDKRRGRHLTPQRAAPPHPFASFSDMQARSQRWLSRLVLGTQVPC